MAPLVGFQPSYITHTHTHTHYTPHYIVYESKRRRPTVRRLCDSNNKTVARAHTHIQAHARKSSTTRPTWRDLVLPVTGPLGGHTRTRGTRRRYGEKQSASLSVMEQYIRAAGTWNFPVRLFPGNYYRTHSGVQYSLGRTSPSEHHTHTHTHAVFV